MTKYTVVKTYFSSSATWEGAGQVLGALDQAQPKTSPTLIASYS
jgi:hypothetical protein